MFVNNSDVLIQSEDRASEQERLSHIIEQSASHVVNLDHLIRHQRDAAHDEQHRTGVLRDFEAFLVFHGVRKSFTFLLFYFFTFFTFLPFYTILPPPAPRMRVML
jgi:hypothetical protein